MKPAAITMMIRFFFVLLFYMFSGSVGATEGRHALIIGIGQYSAASNTQPLLGVPQDMVNARRIANEMGIPNSSIVMLRDEQATKANIQAEFKKLSDKVQPGDRVFIYHSGHGTRYPKGNSCLQGLQTYTTGKFMYEDILTEEEIASYTKPISEKADKVLVMFDACFSGGVINSATRSLSDRLAIRPKFSTSSVQSCENVGVNQGRTRSLLSEIKRLGVNEENFVQIAAAKDNEVSWDNKDMGGLATHTLTQCLMGQAKDINASGAVSLEEIRVCAQSKLDELMKPHAKAGLLPSTIQVRGNRNLIPVAVVKPPAVEQPVAPPAVNTVENSVLQPQKPESVKPNQDVQVVALPSVQTLPSKPPAILNTPLKQEEQIKPPSVGNSDAIVTNIKPPPTEISQSQPTPLRPEHVKPVVVPPNLASIETLKDILNQRNPKRVVDVKIDKPTLKIGVDSLKLEIKSNQDGYLYVILLGSDAKSFYLLYPNGLDSNNKISKLKPMQFPKPDWEIKAAGPEGTDQLLIMVTDSPRQINTLTMASPTAAEPFTYTLNDIGGRAALIDFLTGSGINGRSESFGAKLVSVKEVQK